MRQSLDFGNIVNLPTKGNRYFSLGDLAYDCRAHQAAQALYMIGEALQRERIDGKHAIQHREIAISECNEAVQILTGLKNILSREVVKR